MSDELMWAFNDIDLNFLNVSTNAAAVSTSSLDSACSQNLPTINHRPTFLKSELSPNSRNANNSSNDNPSESRRKNVNDQNTLVTSPSKTSFYSFKQQGVQQKCLRMATKISRLDEVLQRLKVIEEENLSLKEQMNGFQKTAHEIHTMYLSEKETNQGTLNRIQELQEKYNKCNDELHDKIFECEQFKAQLDEMKIKPIHYDELIVKYLRLEQKYEDEKLTKGERITIDAMKKYCLKKNLKFLSTTNVENANINTSSLFGNNSLGLKSSKRKFQNEINNHNKSVQYVDQSIQCNIKEEKAVTAVEPPPEINSICIQCDLRPKPITCTRGVQCKSAMINRGTSTTSLIKCKDVGTNFPGDSFSSLNVDEIISKTAQWQMELIKPIEEVNNNNSNNDGHKMFDMKQKSKIFKTVGTCTKMQNVRHCIGYVSCDGSLLNDNHNHNHTKINHNHNSCLRSTNDNVFFGKSECYQPVQPVQSIIPSTKPIINTNVSYKKSSFNENSNFQEIWQTLGYLVLDILEHKLSNTSSKYNTKTDGAKNLASFLKNSDNDVCVELLRMIFGKTKENSNSNKDNVVSLGTVSSTSTCFSLTEEDQFGRNKPTSCKKEDCNQDNHKAIADNQEIHKMDKIDDNDIKVVAHSCNRKSPQEGDDDPEYSSSDCKKNRQLPQSKYDKLYLLY